MFILDKKAICIHKIQLKHKKYNTVIRFSTSLCMYFAYSQHLSVDVYVGVDKGKVCRNFDCDI